MRAIKQSLNRWKFMRDACKYYFAIDENPTICKFILVNLLALCYYMKVFYRKMICKIRGHNLITVINENDEVERECTRCGEFWDVPIV